MPRSWPSWFSLVVFPDVSMIWVNLRLILGPSRSHFWVKFPGSREIWPNRGLGSKKGQIFRKNQICRIPINLPEGSNYGFAIDSKKLR